MTDFHVFNAQAKGETVRVEMEPGTHRDVAHVGGMLFVGTLCDIESAGAERFSDASEEVSRDVGAVAVSSEQQGYL